VVSLLSVIASIQYFKDNRNQDEYYALILLATVGMMVVASAPNDLLSLFVGFELASMSTYVLAGFEKKNPASLEAAIKIFHNRFLSHQR